MCVNHVMDTADTLWKAAAKRPPSAESGTMMAMSLGNHNLARFQFQNAAEYRAIVGTTPADQAARKAISDRQQAEMRALIDAGLLLPSTLRNCGELDMWADEADTETIKKNSKTFAMLYKMVLKRLGGLDPDICLLFERCARAACVCACARMCLRAHCLRACACAHAVCVCACVCAHVFERCNPTLSCALPRYFTLRLAELHFGHINGNLWTTHVIGGLDECTPPARVRLCSALLTRMCVCVCLRVSM